MNQDGVLTAAVVANTRAVGALLGWLARRKPKPPVPAFILLSAVQEVGGTGVMVTVRRVRDGADAMWAVRDNDFGGPPF